MILVAMRFIEMREQVTRNICSYFALIIRAISVLEGIALVGDEDFAIIDEAFPYIAQRLLTDDSPRLRAALHYMVYGKGSTLDIERLIDLLSALETFSINSKTATGDLLRGTNGTGAPEIAAQLPGGPVAGRAPGPMPPPLVPGMVVPLLPTPISQMLAPVFVPWQQGAIAGAVNDQPEGMGLPWESSTGVAPEPRVRAALQFMLSPEGSFFRSFLLDEIVCSIDALSRSQLDELVRQLRLEDVLLPVWLPGATRRSMPLGGHVTDADRKQVESVAKLMNFLVGGSLRDALTRNSMQLDVLPFLPLLAREVVPEVVMRLSSRVAARFIRYVYA
jgi:aarF domain-containing kinase